MNKIMNKLNKMVEMKELRCYILGIERQGEIQ
jgi:hypothetical protein